MSDNEKIYHLNRLNLYVDFGDPFYSMFLKERDQEFYKKFKVLFRTEFRISFG